MGNFIVAIIIVVVLGILASIATSFIPEYSNIIWIAVAGITLLSLVSAIFSR